MSRLAARVSTGPTRRHAGRSSLCEQRLRWPSPLDPRHGYRPRPYSWPWKLSPESITRQQENLAQRERAWNGGKFATRGLWEIERMRKPANDGSRRKEGPGHAGGAIA